MVPNVICGAPTSLGNLLPFSAPLHTVLPSLGIKVVRLGIARCLNQFQFINFYNQLILSILWCILEARDRVAVCAGHSRRIGLCPHRKFDCQPHLATLRRCVKRANHLQEHVNKINKCRCDAHFAFVLQMVAFRPGHTPPAPAPAPLPFARM